MFIDAHYECDKPGCSKTISQTQFAGHFGNPREPEVWYRIDVYDKDGSRWFDFCSKACMVEYLRVDPDAIRGIRKDHPG